MIDLISKATSKLAATQKNAGKTAASIEVAKHQHTKKQSEYDLSLQSGDLAQMKASAKEKAELETIISDLELKLETEQQDIESHSAKVEEAKRQTERNQLADLQQTKLNDIEKPYKAALRALQNSSSAVQILRDVLEENGLSNDEYLAASLASDLRHYSPGYFKSEYINHNWKTFLEVCTIEDGKLGHHYQPEDETLPFDKAFQYLFLKPLLNQIDGLRAGILDIPEARHEPVEAKPIPKVTRKTIDVLQHFYVTYENKSYEIIDKAFYAFHQYSVLEAVADSAIDAGYALDTKDPEYQDKLKRYNLTVTDKPIMEHEVSMKNTLHLGDPAGLLSED